MQALPVFDPAGDRQRRGDRAEAGDVLVSDLAAFPAGLDEALLQPARRLSEANEHCSGKSYRDIGMAAIHATTLPVATMNLELDPDEERALAAELKRVIADDRYPLSRRIRTLQATLDKLAPPPPWAPLPPPKIYAPPRAKPGQRRGRG
jgi:hypothetical protein